MIRGLAYIRTMTARYDPIVSEFDSPEQEAAYDKWFREKVAASLADQRPPIPHDEVMAGAKRILERRRKKAC
jgi:hypothetical protein